jgi:formate--tetrahydrofolate ligase
VYGEDQYSLSHDPSLLGRPTGFRVPMRDVSLSAVLVTRCGDMRTMPGLAAAPAASASHHFAKGNVVGLFKWQDQASFVNLSSGPYRRRAVGMGARRPCVPSRARR